ncbi:hypothetical protein BFF78_41245 [Streptomyces fodineus]|uniref:Uncharacterized protein n=1 Tax=Streptomyces fodineus TaxID=1904616 RepID=A0A1D7YM29_9ACTN|nr:hypothetical protein [Streptomyces fodineus]AOR36635.1 hypothetical protein BFF78_41245 [Streptomyces fodineus]
MADRQVIGTGGANWSGSTNVQIEFFDNQGIAYSMRVEGTNRYGPRRRVLSGPAVAPDGRESLDLAAAIGTPATERAGELPATGPYLPA